MFHINVICDTIDNVYIYKGIKLMKPTLGTEFCLIHYVNGLCFLISKSYSNTLHLHVLGIRMWWGHERVTPVVMVNDVLLQLSTYLYTSSSTLISLYNDLSKSACLDCITFSNSNCRDVLICPCINMFCTD